MGGVFDVRRYPGGFENPVDVVQIGIIGYDEVTLSCGNNCPLDKTTLRITRLPKAVPFLRVVFLSLLSHTEYGDDAWPRMASDDCADIIDEDILDPHLLPH